MLNIAPLLQLPTYFPAIKSRLYFLKLCSILSASTVDLPLAILVLFSNHPTTGDIWYICPSLFATAQPREDDVSISSILQNAIKVTCRIHSTPQLPLFLRMEAKWKCLAPAHLRRVVNIFSKNIQSFERSGLLLHTLVFVGGCHYFLIGILRVHCWDVVLLMLLSAVWTLLTLSLLGFKSQF